MLTRKEGRACKRILTITIVISLLLSLFLTFSVDNECSSAAESSSKPLSKKWTFMVYFANDNSLNDEGYSKLHDEIKPLGSDGNVDIVVLMDYKDGEAFGDGKTHLYYVEPGELIEFTGIFAEEENTADPCILSKFVNWTIDNYPSEHYCLSVWDHGDGWDTSGGNCADDNPGGTMTMTEMKKAFSWIKEHLENATGNVRKGYSGVYLDIVGYDECLMAQFEVEYQFKDYLNIIVASEEVESSGWPYDTILSHLKENSSMSPEEFAVVIVDDYMDSRPTKSSQTMSAYNLTRLDNNLSVKTNDFFQLLKHKAGTYHSEIETSRSNTEDFSFFSSGSPYYDLYDFAFEINNTVPDQEIKNASQELMKSIKYSCINEGHHEEGTFAHPNTYGMHFYFPTDGSNHWGGNYYRDLDSSLDTQLDEFLDHYANSEDSTNLIPTCSVTNPSEGEVVDSNYTVSGSASDDDGIDCVQIKVDRGAWQNATGTTAWTWLWDTTQYSNGEHTIFVRSSDLNGDADYSSTSIRNVTVNNGGDLSVGPPTDIDAVLEGASYEHVNITWTLSMDDGGGENDVAGYDVYYNQTYTEYDYNMSKTYTKIGFVNAGVSYFVHDNDGLNTTNSYYYITAKDGSGNTEATVDQAGKFVKGCVEGWNFISDPYLNLDGTDITEVLRTLEWDTARWWDSTDAKDHWKCYASFKPSGFNDLDEMNRTMGIWVNVTIGGDHFVDAGRVYKDTTVQMYKGWNLVSYASFIDRTVEDALNGLPYDQVEGFDETNSPYYLKILADTDMMKAGCGYWIRVSEDCIWTVEN